MLTNENKGGDHPSSVIQLRIIQNILMKELKFVLVGVNCNLLGCWSGSWHQRQVQERVTTL